MRVETTNRSSHGGANEILLLVEVDEVSDGRLENRLDDRTRDDGLGDNGLAAALDPVDRGRLLVGAIVARKSKNLHVREMFVHRFEALLRRLAYWRWGTIVSD